MDFINDLEGGKPLLIVGDIDGAVHLISMRDYKLELFQKLDHRETGKRIHSKNSKI